MTIVTCNNEKLPSNQVLTNSWKCAHWQRVKYIICTTLYIFQVLNGVTNFQFACILLCFTCNVAGENVCKCPWRDLHSRVEEKMDKVQLLKPFSSIPGCVTNELLGTWFGVHFARFSLLSCVQLKMVLPILYHKAITEHQYAMNTWARRGSLEILGQKVFTNPLRVQRRVKHMYSTVLPMVHGSTSIVVWYTKYLGCIEWSIWPFWCRWTLYLETSYKVQMLLRANLAKEMIKWRNCEKDLSEAENLKRCIEFLSRQWEIIASTSSIR